jgi:uncharacterized repeat protein (TIGR01451 family)
MLGLAGLLIGQMPAPLPDAVPALPQLGGQPVQVTGSMAPPLLPLSTEPTDTDLLSVPAKNPPAMVPVTAGGGRGKVPLPVVGDPVPACRPPAFKLIETPPAKNAAPLGPALPSVTVEALPPGSVATPCLVLERTGPASVKAGQPFSYVIIVRNAGGVFAKQAWLVEELPPGSRFVGAEPTTVAQGDRLSWTLDDLAPGAERRFTVEVEASADGEWSAQANLTVAVASTLKVRVALALAPAPQRFLHVTGPTTVPVGHPVAFGIRVNNATAAPLGDLLLRVHLSAGLHHLEGDAIEAPLGDLAVGQTKSLTLDAISLQTGNLVMHTALFSGKKMLAEATVTVLATEQPILVLRQTGSLAPRLGSEELFKIEVVNRSPAQVNDVVINDQLPEGLHYVTGDAGANYDPATHTIRWNLGNLAPGQTRQLVFRATTLVPGPRLNRLSARTADGHEAQLHTILRVLEK